MRITACCALRWVLIATVSVLLCHLAALGWFLAHHPYFRTSLPTPPTLPRRPPPRPTNANIPNVLLFNHRINLLTECTHNGLTAGDACSPGDIAARDNVHEIIAAHPGAAVHFFSDKDCNAALQRVQPKLAEHFAEERDGRIKSDLCRLAMLSESGGYYFDCDLFVFADARATLQPAARFAMVTAYRSNASHELSFFQAFLASEQSHPLLHLALEQHQKWYEAKLAHDTNYTARIASGKLMGSYNLGTLLIRVAYEELAGRAVVEATVAGGFDEAHGVQLMREVSR